LIESPHASIRLIHSFDSIEHEVHIQTELATDLPSIRADRVQLQQVFIEIEYRPASPCSRAIIFTNEFIHVD